jgi:hypothetical protein
MSYDVDNFAYNSNTSASLSYVCVLFNVRQHNIGYIDVSLGEKIPAQGLRMANETRTLYANTTSAVDQPRLF